MKNYFLGIGLFLCCMIAAGMGAWSASFEEKSTQPQVLGSMTAVNIRGQRGPKATPPKPYQAANVQLDQIAAESFLVYDPESATVLLSRNPNQQLPIASLTKLMTAYVAYQHITLSDMVPITVNGKVFHRPRLGLSSPGHVSAEDLFNAMLIGSANDAAKQLAEYTEAQTGKNFIDLMNQTAADLGMTQTHFDNPVGLDSTDNYSTASDLSLLIKAMSSYTAFELIGRATAYQLTSQEGQHYHIQATNRLVARDPELFAIKTGLTPQAHGAMVVKIIHQGHPFIITVLKSTARETDVKTLKNTVIESFVWTDQIGEK
jgi:serine-type D-Ala-D-Ala carboxypeptidase (penicillin-binding protein 5/6)